MGWDAETIRKAGELLALGGGAPVVGIETVCGIATHIDDDPSGDIIVIMPSGFDERLTLDDGSLLQLMAQTLVRVATRNGEDCIDLGAMAHIAKAWAILDPLVQRYREGATQVANAFEWPNQTSEHRSPADLTPPADTTIDPAGSVEQ